MAKKENKEIKKAIKAYEVLTGDEEMKRLAELRLMSKLEENSALVTAKEKGRGEGLRQGKKEGKEEGKKEEKRKIAKNLLSMGVELEKIIDATGLSKEEIKEIQ